MSKTLVIGLVIVLLVAGAGYLVYQNLYSWPQLTGENLNFPFLNNPPYSGTTTTEQATSTREFVVSGENFTFSPSMINVKKGDRVRIVYKNLNGTHDFRIDEFGIRTERIQGLGEQTIEFVADKVGSYEYYCSVGNHRAMGMKGTLQVQ